MILHSGFSVCCITLVAPAMSKKVCLVADIIASARYLN